MSTTKVDNLITRMKNNPVLALLITTGVVVIAVASFTGALHDLMGTFKTLRGTPEAVDITGKWRAVEQEEGADIQKTYFDFKVVDNKLFGTVLLPSTFHMQNSESGILDGKVIASKVSFTTRNQHVKEFGRYNVETKQRSPNIKAEFVTRYEGEVRENQIHFRTQSDSGYFKEFIADKIIDQSIITPDQDLDTSSNRYRFLFSLDGHPGGVQSLSYGPDKARFVSGGLRLTSGGARDGMIRYWDIAMAEPRGSRLLVSSTSGQGFSDSQGETDDAAREKMFVERGSVHVMTSPLASRGRADITTVGATTERKHITFYDWLHSPGGSASGGGRTRKLKTAVGPITISGNAKVTALAKPHGPSTHRIFIVNSSGVAKNTLDTKYPVHMLALNDDGRLLASTEDLKSDETGLKLWDTKTGKVKWKITSVDTITHLAFSVDGTLLVVAKQNKDGIEIRDTGNGEIKTTLSGGADETVSSLAFANGTKMFAAAYASGVIKFWDASTGTLAYMLTNKVPVTTLAFSYDDRLLAMAGTGDSVIYVWVKPVTKNRL